MLVADIGVAPCLLLSLSCFDGSSVVKQLACEQLAATLTSSGRSLSSLGLPFCGGKSEVFLHTMHLADSELADAAASYIAWGWLFAKGKFCNSLMHPRRSSSSRSMSRTRKQKLEKKENKTVLTSIGGEKKHFILPANARLRPTSEHRYCELSFAEGRERTKPGGGGEFHQLIQPIIEAE